MNVGFETGDPAAWPASRFRILHCLRAPVGGLFRHVCDLTAEQARRGNALDEVLPLFGVVVVQVDHAVRE